MMKSRKNRAALIAAVISVIVLALPMSVYATTPPPAGAAGGSMQVEYRYAAGEAPNVPGEITRFGFVYRLVSVSDPVFEGELPSERTYTYRVEGALTHEQLADIQGLGDLKLTKQYVLYEEEIDKTANIRMSTNDVDSIPKKRAFEVTQGDSSTGATGVATKELELTGVTFEIVDENKDGIEDLDGRGLPAGYNAAAVYRGVQTHAGFGYYLAEATYTTLEPIDGIEIYVVVAEYVTDVIPPPIDEFELIEGAPIPGDSGTDTGLATIDDERIALQGPNLIQNLIDGNVPMGGIGVKGVWSFLSMILSAVAIGVAVVFTIGAISQKRRAGILSELGVYDEEKLVMLKRRGVILRALTIIFGLITLFTWLVLDNFNQGVVWINNHTITIGILCVATIVLCIVTNARRHKILSDDEEYYKEKDNAAYKLTS